MTLTMPAGWIHGAANCASDQQSDLQVHRAEPSTWILRQNKCANAEGPFLYILFGTSRLLLLDTGARPVAGRTLPLRDTVERIITQWIQEKNLSGIDLIVAHTHSHADHIFGDSQFEGRSRTTIVRPGVAAVKQFFGLNQWPSGSAVLDLGGRRLTVLPCPGHEESHIAIYDSNTETLLTGDTVYPGVLIVHDWLAFRKSAATLADIARANPVKNVLGAHIEMKRAAKQFFIPQTPFQPDEHVLPLGAEHLEQLRQAAIDMGANPRSQRILDDFVIEPV